MSSQAMGVPLRSWRDRARQVALFELIGLLLIAPGFALVTARPLGDSMGLLLVLSLLAAGWNAAYGTTVDWCQARWFGSRADQRRMLARLAHALCFEGGLLLLSLPIIAVWTGMGWRQALLMDVGLTLVYAAYAFVFNLLYDRRFPIG